MQKHTTVFIVSVFLNFAAVFNKYYGIFSDRIGRSAVVGYSYRRLDQKVWWDLMVVVYSWVGSVV